MATRPRAVVAGRLLLTMFAASCALGAQAAELVTLRNGFSVSCSSREAISPDTIRLHLDGATTGPQSYDAAASAAQNYMDVPLASIVAVETAPDTLAPSVAVALPPQAKASDVTVIAERSGETHNLNVSLLMAVIRAESAGNTHAVSRTGARGLMQLMPATAGQLGVADSFSPEANVNGGSAYLDGLLTRYHENILLALAAYNAGPAAVDRYHGIPPYRETQIYVAKVIREWNRLVAANHVSLASVRVPAR